MSNFRFNKYFGSEERTPFNFAELLLRRLDNLFIKANESSVIGETFIWYRVLIAIKRSISFKLNDEQKEELKELIGDIKQLLQGAKDQVVYFELEEALDKLETRLAELMYEYGLYYPKYDKKKDWSKEAEEEDV